MPKSSIEQTQPAEAKKEEGIEEGAQKKEKLISLDTPKTEKEIELAELRRQEAPLAADLFELRGMPDTYPRKMEVEKTLKPIQSAIKDLTRDIKDIEIVTKFVGTSVTEKTLRGFRDKFKKQLDELAPVRREKLEALEVKQSRLVTGMRAVNEKLVWVEDETHGAILSKSKDEMERQLPEVDQAIQKASLDYNALDQLYERVDAFERVLETYREKLIF